VKRRQRAITIIAASSMLGAAMFVLRGAIVDRGSIESARADLQSVGEDIAATRVSSALEHLRSAVSECKPVLDASWAMHAWSRVFRSNELQSLRTQLEQAVAAVEDAVRARAARADQLRILRDEIDRADDIAELLAIDARRAVLAAQLALDSPSAYALLETRIAERRNEFESDQRRNQDAMAAWKLQISEAAANDRSVDLLAVIDAVPPATVRGDEKLAFDLLRSQAASLHGEVLIRTHIRPALAAAKNAASASAARAVMQGLRDAPELQRIPAPSGARALADARTMIAARIAELDAWELGLRSINQALAAGTPGPAAAALARLPSCDDRTATELTAFRAAFPARAVASFIQGAIAAVDRSDWVALAARADEVRPGSVAWMSLDAPSQAAVTRALAQVDLRVDRGLYQQFVREPRVELADRYLQAWPLLNRRMAPIVLAWRSTALDGRTALEMFAVRWSSTGAESPAVGLEDRPDARIEIRIDGETVMIADAVDIREGETSTFDPPLHYETSMTTNNVLRVAGEVRIDLRDALVTDPIAVGSVSMPVRDWRAARVVEIPVTDASWSGRAHRVLLRVMMPDSLALPPFASGAK
jgi:hypothetical protein